MTRPEQPAPYPGDLIADVSGLVRYRRSYLDALRRPMTGVVTLTGTSRVATGGVVILPAPVKVALVDGVLDVELPADEYRLTADLRTADGHHVTDADAVILSAVSP